MQTLLQPPPPISTTATKKKRISFSKIEDKKGCRIGLYGSAGVGKTTLAATMHGKKVFIDLDNSLSILKSKFPPEVLESTFILKVSDWQELIENLNEDGWNEINTIVIDTLTKAEELAVNHVIKTIPYKGNFVKNIEEICQTPGLNCIFVGTGDLTQDLGCPGELDHPEVTEAIQRVLKACKKYGVVPGIVTASEEEAVMRINQGFQLVTCMNDQVFFRTESKKRLEHIREQIK